MRSIILVLCSTFPGFSWIKTNPIDSNLRKFKFVRSITHSSRTIEVKSSIGSESEINLSMKKGRDLNDAQCSAVYAPIGPIRVLAGPGSGKTRVLTRRIAHLISTGSPPWSILALTFTNKAAREMKERVKQIVGDKSASAVQMGTFHSICLLFLRKLGESLHRVSPGLHSSFTVYDSDASRRLLKEIMKKGNFSTAAEDLNAVSKLISMYKRKGLYPDDVSYLEDGRGSSRSSYSENNKKVIEIYPDYQRELGNRNAVDFDDLILLMIKLMKLDENISAKVGKWFKHVLVDEWQDTNEPQYELINLLVNSALKNLPNTENQQKIPSIFVVGDADQSIYAFRGAISSNLDKFEYDFRPCNTIMLLENYRSTKRISSAANAIISKIPDRIEKNIFAVGDEGLLLGLMTCLNEENEAQVVAKQVHKYWKSGKVKLNEIAVMYRTNSQSLAFEKSFLNFGIPFTVVKGQEFFHRKEIRDVLSYLRFLNNPNDENSLIRCINTPPRNIGSKTVTLLMDMVKNDNYRLIEYMLASMESQDRIPLMALINQSKSDSWSFVSEEKLEHLIKNAESDSLLKVLLKKIHPFSSILVQLKIESSKKSVSELLQFLLECTNMESYIEACREREGNNATQSRDRWSNILELVKSSLNFGNAISNSPEGLEAYLSEIALIGGSDNPQLGPEQNQIEAARLMTIHASKGLEFDTVFITGCEEGTLPLIKSAKDSEENDERRLMYVAITRAKARLFLSWRKNLTVFHQPTNSDKKKIRTITTKPSRYLNDIPKDAYKSLDMGGGSLIFNSKMRSEFKNRSNFQEKVSTSTDEHSHTMNIDIERKGKKTLEKMKLKNSDKSSVINRKPEAINSPNANSSNVNNSSYRRASNTVNSNVDHSNKTVMSQSIGNNFIDEPITPSVINSVCGVNNISKNALAEKISANENIYPHVISEQKPTETVSNTKLHVNNIIGPQKSVINITSGVNSTSKLDSNYIDFNSKNHMENSENSANDLPYSSNQFKKNRYEIGFKVRHVVHGNGLIVGFENASLQEKNKLEILTCGPTLRGQSRPRDAGLMVKVQFSGEDGIAYSIRVPSTSDQLEIIKDSSHLF